MKSRFPKMIALLILAGSVFSGCSKDDDEPEENHEELITTVKLTFEPTGGGAPLVYQLQDPDGPGGVAPTQDEIVLAPSTAYNVSIQLLNESVTPAEDVTVEVEEEGDAHRFYFEPSGASNITVSDLDNDSNGVALGLNSTWTTGAAATGSIKITLRHYGNNPPGKAPGDAVDSDKSDTDIDVTFVTKVQ